MGTESGEPCARSPSCTTPGPPTMYIFCFWILNSQRLRLLTDVIFRTDNSQCKSSQVQIKDYNILG